jgi:hypothetical protein
MHFVLSAVGQDLTHPLDAGVLGAFDDAVREAKAMLERYPDCEAVEIFAEGRFVRDIERLPY